MLDAHEKATEDCILLAIGFLSWAGITVTLPKIFNMYANFIPEELDLIMTQVMKTDRWKELKINEREILKNIVDELPGKGSI